MPEISQEAPPAKQQPQGEPQPSKPAGQEPELPDAHFGGVAEDKLDWRAEAEGDEEEAPDDDEELPETPEDVVAMLGFDPLDSDEEEAEEAERSDQETIEGPLVR